MTERTIMLRPLVARDAPALLAFYNGLSTATIRTFRPLREKTTLARCYQLRSHSSGDKTANHQLKLAMGFALHRIVRGADRLGGYFIMPLQTQFFQEKE